LGAHHKTVGQCVRSQIGALVLNQKKEGKAMLDWNAIIWFVIWAVVIFAAVGLAVWVVMFSLMLRSHKEFEKGFKGKRF
jgi:hypothetical protein